MKIVIAYDGTPGSRAVFADLARAGLPPATRATVVSVATEGQAPGARTLLVEEARLLAEGGADHLRTLFPKWKVGAEVVEGAAAPALVEAAERLGADLIVVGTRGLRPEERAVLGSVAREVVTNTRVSARVARPAGGDDARPVRVLLGYDGSVGAEDALAEVLGRKWPKGAEVRVLAATAGDAKGAGNGQDDVNRQLAALEDRLRGAGLAASSVLRKGEAQRALLDEAATWSADAIFLGGRRLQRLRRFLFGSVAGSVADDAPCSVEVVRPAATR